MPRIIARDNENNRWMRNAKKKKTKQKKQKNPPKNPKKIKAEKNNGDKSYSERVRAKWFSCAFKLGFCIIPFLLK